MLLRRCHLLSVCEGLLVDASVSTDWPRILLSAGLPISGLLIPYLVWFGCRIRRKRRTKGDISEKTTNSTISLVVSTSDSLRTSMAVSAAVVVVAASTTAGAANATENDLAGHTSDDDGRGTTARRAEESRGHGAAFEAAMMDDRNDIRVIDWMR